MEMEEKPGNLTSLLGVDQQLQNYTYVGSHIESAYTNSQHLPANNNDRNFQGVYM